MGAAEFSRGNFFGIFVISDILELHSQNIVFIFESRDNLGERGFVKLIHLCFSQLGYCKIG